MAIELVVRLNLWTNSLQTILLVRMSSGCVLGFHPNFGTCLGKRHGCSVVPLCEALTWECPYACAQLVITGLPGLALCALRLCLERILHLPLAAPSSCRQRAWHADGRRASCWPLVFIRNFFTTAWSFLALKNSLGT